MLQKISKKLNLSDSVHEFLKSSSIVFAANMFGAVLGYILVIIVSRELENISMWTALNSVVMIVGIFVAGLATDISKRSAELLTVSKTESYSYLITLKRGVKKTIPFFLILSPLFAFFLQKILGTDFMIGFIILLNIPAQIFSNMNNSFLMGVFEHKAFAQNILTITGVRFLSTVLFLQMGLEIYSLPLGIIVSVLLGWIHNHFQLKHYLHNNTLQKTPTHEKFSLQSEIKSISSTLLASVSLQMPLLILPIVSAALLSPQNADVFAILFTIGQIINFGITAFLALIIPFAANRNDSKIFWVSLFFTIFVGICGVLFFVFFRTIVFSLFSRPEYSQLITEMILYFSSVALFNILFFIGRYMIGKGEQKKIYPLFAVLGAWIVSIYMVGVSGLQLLNFLWWVLGLMVVMLGMISSVFRINRET